MPVDFIGRFENLQDDFNHVCDKIGIEHKSLPHLNHEGFYEGKEIPPPIHYSKHYDSELIEIVRNRCQADIDRFGYEFEEG